MLLRVAAPGPKTTFLTAFAALSLANCVLLAEVDYSLIPDAGAGASGGQGGSSATCRMDSDCNDDLSCTNDRCESDACTHTPVPEGTECGSVTCVSSSACNATGECITTPINIDDGNGCTTDACDPQSGSITHTNVDIDDQVACTTDACDPATGTITHTPSNAGCLSWQPLPTMGAPSAREKHTAVWTGSKMIIWGGEGPQGEYALNTGAMYDPSTRTWSPVTQTGAPTGRHSHRALWTGSKMIVWGGFGLSTIAAGGGMYDPETDTWSPMTTTGEPTGRTRFSMLWNGSKMLIFGGLTGNNMPINQGAAFDPMTNTWTNLPTGGQASPRFNHSGVWTGDRMIIWGGQNYADWLWTGASYNPTTNMWIGPTPFQDVPGSREQHCAVWTGSTMLIWGGWNGGPYQDSGGTFDPATNTWKAITNTNTPAARAEHSCVWTGKNLVVWGGCGEDLCGKVYGDGGVFTPDANGGTWETIPAVGAVAARRRHTTVWTGSSMIVWGGKDNTGLMNTGAEAPLQ